MVQETKRATQGCRAVARGCPLPLAPGKAGHTAQPAVALALGVTYPGWKLVRKKTILSSEQKISTLNRVQKQVGSQSSFWQPGAALPVADSAKHELMTLA